MWGGEESGGREGSNLTLFPSGLWWKAKIKLPAAAISAIWLSTNLIFFHRHTFPNQPFLHGSARARPVNLASSISHVFSPCVRQHWRAAAKPLIPHTAWVRAHVRGEREDVFARPHSSDPSAKRKVPPPAKALVSEKRENKPEGEWAVAAKLNHRYWSSLHLGGKLTSRLSHLIRVRVCVWGGLWIS